MDHSPFATHHEPFRKWRNWQADDSGHIFDLKSRRNDFVRTSKSLLGTVSLQAPLPCSYWPISFTYIVASFSRYSPSSDGLYPGGTFLLASPSLNALTSTTTTCAAAAGRITLTCRTVVGCSDIAMSIARVGRLISDTGVYRIYYYNDT